MSRPLRSLFRAAAMAAVLCLSLNTGCDSGDGDGDGDGDSAGETGATTTGGGSGVCSDPALAATMCDADCAFAPADIDCMNACQNVADQCADGSTCSASDSCVGQNQDVALCMAGCEGSKTLSCSNIVLGCWDTAGGTTNCEDVGTCVQDNNG